MQYRRFECNRNFGIWSSGLSALFEPFCPARLILGGFFLLLCWARFVDPPILTAEESPFAFVQVSDPHVPAVPDRNCSAPETGYLRRAFQEINAMAPSPKFVVFTGDLAAHNGEPEAYAALKACAAELKAPVYYAVGNHDDRAAFRKVVLGESNPDNRPYFYSFTKGPYFFVVLDSTRPGQKAGGLNPEQLDWLRQQLQAHAGLETILLMHHQTYLIGKEDGTALQNRPQFISLLKQFPQVRIVASGHVHLSKVVREDGRFFINTTSLVQRGDPVLNPPGYRIFELSKGPSFVVVDKRLGAEGAREILNKSPK